MTRHDQLEIDRVRRGLETIESMGRGQLLALWGNRSSARQKTATARLRKRARMMFLAGNLTVRDDGTLGEGRI